MGGTYRGAPGVVSVAVDGGEVRDGRFCCGSWQKGECSVWAAQGLPSVVSGSHAALACGEVIGNPCLLVRMRFRLNTGRCFVCCVVIVARLRIYWWWLFSVVPA